MERPLQRLKRPEVEERKNMDRISSLPDELLVYVLSFLPTKCAVGTSILSSRWRCLHMLTTSLSFIAPSEHRESEIKTKKRQFKNFVNRVLLLHKVSPIKKFVLDCGEYTYNVSLIHAWISAVIFKGVERLHLFNIVQLDALPRSLFSSHTIVELRICCSIDDFRVPESIHLPSLMILHLKSLKFSDSDSIGKLCSASPVLRKLKLDRCAWPLNSDRLVRLSSVALKHFYMIACVGRVEVNAPNLTFLRYFCYSGVDTALLLKNSDHLVRAELRLHSTDNSDFARHALMLMKAVHNVKELYLLRGAIKCIRLSEGERIPSYWKLVKLYVDGCSYHTWRYVTHWLTNSRRIETLIVGEGLDEVWPPNAALLPFSSRVKVIVLSKFRGSNTELHLLKHLLNNAGLLKELIVYMGCMMPVEALEASQKLLMFPRASRTCVVKLKTGMQYQIDYDGRFL